MWGRLRKIALRDVARQENETASAACQKFVRQLLCWTIRAIAETIAISRQVRVQRPSFQLKNCPVDSRHPATAGSVRPAFLAAPIRRTPIHNAPTRWGRNPDSGDRQSDTSALEEGVWGRKPFEGFAPTGPAPMPKDAPPDQTNECGSHTHTQPPRNRARPTKRLLREKSQPKDRRPHTPSGRFGDLDGELLAEGTEGSFQLVEPGSVPEI